MPGDEVVERLGWRPRFYDLIGAATAPIYVKTGARRLHPLGSGVFLALGERRFLATAAHVVDDLETRVPVVGFDSSIAEISLEFVATMPPEGKGRREDDLDVAIAEVDPGEILDRSMTAVPVAAFDPDPTESHEDFYIVAGYPYTKQDPKIEENHLEAYLYRATAVSREGRNHSRVGRVVNLDLKFDRRRLFVKGKQVTGPSLKGMSGCGIWRVDQRARTVGLSGTLIEYSKAKRRIRGTRLWFLLSGIWRGFPELRYLLPELS